MKLTITFDLEPEGTMPEMTDDLKERLLGELLAPITSLMSEEFDGTEDWALVITSIESEWSDE